MGRRGLSLFWLVWLWSVPALAQDAHLVIGAPLPSWAETVDPPRPRASAGIECLLDDTQVRVAPRSETELVRIVYTLHSTGSVEDGSQLSIDRPSGTTVVLHHVRRLRDGIAVDVLDRRAVRVIQPEERLNEGLYDESERVIVFLGDVRVEDTIEYAYSLVTPSDLFGGRVAYRSHLGGLGTHWLRFRALWDASRSIAVRTHAVPSSYDVALTAHEVRIEAREVPEPAFHLDTPTWFDSLGWVELSEFASWSEVVAWALPHYSLDEVTPASLPHVPMTQFTGYAGDAERAGAALRFVADEVRYLGLEMGDRAFVPDAPDDVAARRWGDCKDKALLLVAILRALDIEAEPALVNASRGHVLDGDLPSPFAFDHVIVRARIEGREVWMDPTRADEREPVTRLAHLGLERALVIAPGSDGLVDVVDAPPVSDLEVQEHFVVDATDHVTLEVLSVLRGEPASMLRAELGRAGEEEVASQFLEAYASEALAPTALAPTRIEEIGDGALQVREHYAVGSFYVDGVRDISAWSATLPTIEADREAIPLSLPFPRDRVHRVVVDDPAGWMTEPAEEHVDGAYFRVSRSIRVAGHRLTVETRFRTLADHVPPEHLAMYARDLERAQHLLGYEVAAVDEGARPSGVSRGSVLTGLCCSGTCGGFFLLSMLGLVWGATRRSSAR